MFGFSIWPLVKAEGLPAPLTSDSIFGDSRMKNQQGPSQDSVAHPAWLPFATTSEFTFYFINIDPNSKSYGAIKGCVNNTDSEYEVCSSLEILLEKAAAYVEERERAREKFLIERNDNADSCEIEDYVSDSVSFEICNNI